MLLTCLIHFEQAFVHLGPALHVCRDRVQLRGVLKERAVLYLVDPCYRHEIQIVKGIHGMCAFGEFDTQNGVYRYCRLI